MLLLMLPAVGAVASASFEGPRCRSECARCVLRFSSHCRCCCFLFLLFLRFCRFYSYLAVGGKGDVACFTVSVVSPYIRLAVAFADAH